MALDKLIPRIEWNEISVVGDSTISDDEITGISSTSSVKVGMIVTGTGIPADTEVLSKTANSIQLSKNATANGNDITFTLFERFDFAYPPVKDSDEDIIPNGIETRSLSGAEQNQTNYMQFERNPIFSHLTEDEKDTLKNDFFKDWAAYGNSFRYFYDKADSSYVEYSLKTRQFKPKRMAKKHPYFLYEIAFSFKRVE